MHRFSTSWSLLLSHQFWFGMFCRTCFNTVVLSMHHRCMGHPVLLALDLVPSILTDLLRLNHYKEPLCTLDLSMVHFRHRICMVPPVRAWPVCPLLMEVPAAFLLPRQLQVESLFQLFLVWQIRCLVTGVVYNMSCFEVCTKIVSSVSRWVRKCLDLQLEAGHGSPLVHFSTPSFELGLGSKIVIDSVDIHSSRSYNLMLLNRLRNWVVTASSKASINFDFRLCNITPSGIP
jgi:hypothetical protein